MICQPKGQFFRLFTTLARDAIVVMTLINGSSGLGEAFCPLLSSSMAEHPAVNRRVVGSSPT